MDPPSEVWVTVSVEPRRRRLERPLRALRQCSRACSLTYSIAALAAVAALAGAAVGELVGSGTAASHRRPAEARVLAEAAAYRFPLGCLGATLSGRSLLGADAVARRTGPCWHYGVYVTAVLRRVDGVWRLMLDAHSHSCPNVALPPAIRALLATCAKVEGAVGRTPQPAFARRTAAR